MKTSKSCHYCNTKIKGRPDKKFCDGHCRSAFHNDRLRDELRDVRKVNRQLIKNRSILKDFFKKGVRRIPSFRLEEEGFSFHYYTKVKNLGDLTCTFCYEIGYVEEEQGYYRILSGKEMETGMTG